MRYWVWYLLGGMLLCSLTVLAEQGWLREVDETDRVWFEVDISESLEERLEKLKLYFPTVRFERDDIHHGVFAIGDDCAISEVAHLLRHKSKSKIRYVPLRPGLHADEAAKKVRARFPNVRVHVVESQPGIEMIGPAGALDQVREILVGPDAHPHFRVFVDIEVGAIDEPGTLTPEKDPPILHSAKIYRGRHLDPTVVSPSPWFRSPLKGHINFRTLLAKNRLECSNGGFEVSRLIDSIPIIVFDPLASEFRTLYRRVGVELKVRATPFPDDKVQVHLRLETSEPIGMSGATPLVRQAKGEISLLVGDESQIVIGGLFQKNGLKANEFPLLAELPRLGPMFRETGHPERMVVVLRPKISRLW